MSGYRKQTDYPVNLLGFADEGTYSRERLNCLFNTLWEGYSGLFKFPMTGYVIGLNFYGEPLVSIEYPATTLIPLSFFKTKQND